MLTFRMIAVVAVLCTVAACSSPADDDPDQDAAPKSAAPAASSPGAPIVPGDDCIGEDIRAEATVQAAGVALLTLTNASSTPCRLSGWPKLTLLAADGSALTVPVQEVAQPGPSTPSEVDPGESAFAGLKWTTCDKAADCAVATTLTIAPEGGGAPVVATIIGAGGGSETVTELAVGGLTVGTIQPSTQGVVAW